MKKKKTGIIVGSCIALAVILAAMPIVTSINWKVTDYPYSPELPKPGIGVDVTNTGLPMRAYMAWNDFFNRTASKLWSAPEGVVKHEFQFTARDGAVINGFMLEPEGSEGKTLTTMFYCHGGGFFIPMMPFNLDLASYYVRELNYRIFLPDYRVAPANPYPTPINDCYDALEYVAGLDCVDTDRVIIYGESAGGCLAAETLHMCRDEGLLKPLGGMLIYPVADNAQTYESLTEYEYTTWTRQANINMWNMYLNEVDMESAEYAVPMQQEDFSDYPPIYLEPAEMDILRDQDIALAEKMREAGVEVAGEVTLGAYHGFEGDLKSELAKRVLETRVNWLRNLENSAEN